jgi:hypothetical protein
MLAALGAYALFAATFASFRVSNDGLVYFDFLRRLLGEHVRGIAYQFGVAYFNLPFYLAGRALQELGVASVVGAPPPQAAIAVASNVALVLTLWIGWRLLRRLDLPAGPVVLLLALFGSPLFYYTAFQPSYKHAVDALGVTLLALLLLLAVERLDGWVTLALGAVLAGLISIRYANIGLLPGAALPFWFRRDGRRFCLGVLALVGTSALLFGIPAARGIHFKRRSDVALAAPAPAKPQIVVAGLLPSGNDICRGYSYKLTLRQCLRNKFGVDLQGTAPLRMLFSVRRGLFLWTPLTAVSLFGFALAFRSRPERSRYLATLAVAALGLVWVHAIWGDFWTNGFSFSQRFLAGLFPVFLIGVAELVRRWRLWAVGALTLCALFSLYVGFNHYLGYGGISERDDLGTVLTTKDDRDVTETLRLIGHTASERWRSGRSLP